MPSAASSTTDSPPTKCRIAEILQFSCDQELTEEGVPQFHCWPVPRIFRICPGRPAVEITRFVDIDVNSGEVSLPRTASQQLPKGKPWRDIKTYAEHASRDD